MTVNRTEQHTFLVWCNPLQFIFHSAQENLDLRKKLKEYECLLQERSSVSHRYSRDSQRLVFTFSYEKVIMFYSVVCQLDFRLYCIKNKRRRWEMRFVFKAANSRWIPKLFVRPACCTSSRLFPCCLRNTEVQHR